MRQAAAARRRAIREAREAGASREEIRTAGALAEIEYLDATGMFVRYVARLRETLRTGGTCTQWAVSYD
ncbi:hypothetical protein OG529_04260 [Streptomyces longwoodensis]|uniref:hypothetical protein n=1 Tax=Streptomyces longwoodensis TaxID=68231 RepID=UPI0032451399